MNQINRLGRPLIVTDCDEVLLHMVAPFRDWLSDAHGIRFDMSGGDFTRAMTRAGTGDQISPDGIWLISMRFSMTKCTVRRRLPGRWRL